MSEGLPEERPDRKVLTIWLVSSTITCAILALLLLVPIGILVLLGRSTPKLLLLGLGPLLLWLLTVLSMKKQWEHWGFRITPEALEIRQGWLWRKRRIVARDRIQHVDINSGPLDRRFGLVQVVVHTAGTEVGMIPGISPERADRMREELMQGRDI
ncbi:MAG TPA: PH domain-containing protein [Fimbriimonadaceae bacterium]|nr:PH domain-containing protein [Fimbriimonadaceae bacterium]